MIARNVRVKRRRTGKPRRGVIVDEAYLAWIRQQPCILCALGVAKLKELGWPDPKLQTFPTEAAHVGDRGFGQRAQDRTAIPLCSMVHHREGPKSHHVLGKYFWPIHGLDRHALIQHYNAKYEQETGYVEPA